MLDTFANPRCASRCKGDCRHHRGTVCQPFRFTKRSCFLLIWDLALIAAAVVATLCGIYAMEKVYDLRYRKLSMLKTLQMYQDIKYFSNYHLRDELPGINSFKKDWIKPGHPYYGKD